MSNTKKLVFAALCVALGVALPVAFHGVPNAGQVFCPMHIPVLLCGLICGPWLGLACGVLVPMLGCLITGMPPMAMLPSMIVELAVYGLVAGLLIRLVKMRFAVVVSLVGAMVAGRLAMGLVNALIFYAGEYSWMAWLTAAFVTALPGIMIHLLLIPTVIFALKKAKLIM